MSMLIRGNIFECSGSSQDDINQRQCMHAYQVVAIEQQFLNELKVSDVAILTLKVDFYGEGLSYCLRLDQVKEKTFELLHLIRIQLVLAQS